MNFMAMREKLREWGLRCWATLRRSPSDRDLKRELEAHLVLASEELQRRGHSPREAARLARAQSGGLDQAMERLYDQRGLPWLGRFALDVKLGFRMLRKYWGLTLVAGLAMTVAMSIGAVVTTILDSIGGGVLPLVEGDRIVAIQTWDAASRSRRSTAPADYERWRDSLASLEDVGAFRAVQRDLIVEAGATRAITVAEITASGFRLTRVNPLIGRSLVANDERVDAEPVIVIGYDAWQSQFGGDAAILGRNVQLDGVTHSIVGVMPEGFGFPVNHRFWAALRGNPSRYMSEAGPEDFVVFGRLVPGVALEAAEVELTSIGLSSSSVGERTTEQLRPRILPYAAAFVGEGILLFPVIQFFLVLLLIPPCANIAILIYGRTVSRQEEFATRFALGASRTRIVAQLFIEVLVLAAVAATVALILARTLGWYLHGEIVRRGNSLPFWMDFSLSLKTVVFVGILALFAATVSGLLPAIQATGRQMQAGLRSFSSRAGPRLGATWTCLVIIQIALCLAILPSAVELAWGNIRPGMLGPGFATEEFLTARLGINSAATPTSLNPDSDGLATRFADVQRDLVRRLRAEPEIREVATAAALPATDSARVGIDGIPAQVGPVPIVQTNYVDGAFFQLFDLPIMTGRRFSAGDFERESDAVIVNRSFVERVFGTDEVLGRRIRYLEIRGERRSTAASDSELEYEIVGVVGDMDTNARIPEVYHPAVPGRLHPLRLAMRVNGDLAAATDRLREIAATLDPNLTIDDIRTLDDIYRQRALGNNLGAFAIVAACLSVIILSAAGIYAMMSFTVNQRRREIGIRSALGAQPRHMLRGIFSKALRQVVAGVVVGLAASMLLRWYWPAEDAGGWPVPGILPAAAIFMSMVGLLAAAGPARRALRVQPTEALRDGT